MKSMGFCLFFCLECFPYFFLIVVISEKHTNYQKHCISGYYTVKSVAALCLTTTIQHKLNECHQCSGKYSLCIFL